MAYFSNGSEGMDFEEGQCVRYVHYDGGACPVLELHADWNYEQVSAMNDRYEKREPKDEASEAKRQALETFIPSRTMRCRMFHEEARPEPVQRREMQLLYCGEAFV